jgi:hypothetical protein
VIEARVLELFDFLVEPDGVHHEFVLHLDRMGLDLDVAQPQFRHHTGSQRPVQPSRKPSPKALTILRVQSRWGEAMTNVS